MVDIILTFLGSMLNFLRPTAKSFDFGFALQHGTKTVLVGMAQAAELGQKPEILASVMYLN